MRRVEISVYCKFMVLLFQLGALYGGRGSTCSQDSGSDIGKVELQDDRCSVSTLQSEV